MNWLQLMGTLAREFRIDPWSLDMDQIDGLLETLLEIREQTTGVVDHRRAAERIAAR